MIARWLAFWWLAAPLFGQFGFYAVNGGAEQPLDTSYSLGTAGAGDGLAQCLRLKNIGTADGSVSLLSISGAGFVLKEVPRLPQTLPSGQYLEFTVGFQANDTGSYSASLKADRLSVFLEVTVTPSLTVFVAESGGQRRLSAGATVDFGSVERGSQASRRFTLSNQTRQGLLPAVALSGSGFRLDSAAPTQLAPGDSATFTVICMAEQAGTLSAVLQIEQRQITLKASVTEPPLPRPAIVLDLLNAASGQQGTVSVRLVSAARGRGSGKLSVDFRSSIAGADDPAVLFPLTGSRTIPVSVVEGDTAARFGALSAVEFQTGTTAGMLLFTLQLGGFTDQATVTVAPAPVHLEAVSAARSGNSLELRISGFDNTRTTGGLAFTFYDRSGVAVAPGKIQVECCRGFPEILHQCQRGGHVCAYARSSRLPGRQARSIARRCRLPTRRPRSPASRCG
jgi:hypothetical protein